ncbi:MAG: LysR family transcriptional regulator [Pseudomonadota bacterium]|jgi:DNA-binding transcriptional LysR family regulator|nr:LysR family transcriptional regulator [Pseudomonadota bacterium]
MDRFQSFNAFVKVVEHGSFAVAAQRLEISTSAVSRQVAEMEAHLEVRLLNRTTRRLSLTEAGQAFYERCVQLLADLEETEAAVRSEAVVPKGTLRLTCGVTFGERYLAPAVAEFATRHPQVAFDIDLSDRAVDLVEEGFDLAIRIGPVGQQALVARRIAETQLVCCAAPAYLDSRPPLLTPDDLQHHECFAYTYAATASAWTFEAGDGTRHTPRISFRHRANNGRMLAAMAVAGVGISLEPDFIVADEVRTGRLVRVLTDYQPPRSPISAVYPSRRHLSAKVRTFVDFLASRYAGATEWSL